ncbi:hypothetical protein T11_2997 [Trichinella zimbabwensis]|uniref:Uncharacterized protein n=1 Tax=Trichinella zimbabwensis TaxID=268475 RepID=A0A0V1GNB1_9BILA|nr:hypothetical protein T11_10444 [Trichinella zimbabwensis]KRY99772.1 hypothetical protein T11_2997 [Trichinella zimbabwensis]
MEEDLEEYEEKKERILYRNRIGKGIKCVMVTARRKAKLPYLDDE